jgi:hypothetical protein
MSGAPLLAQEVSLPSAVQQVDIAPPVHPVTADQVHEYFAITGLESTLHDLMGKMLNGMRATSSPSIPPSVWDQMEHDFKAYDLFSAIFPAYQKYISEEDMATVIAYQKTDAAKRMKAAEPYVQSLLSDTMRKAGADIGRRAAEDHKDEIAALQRKLDAEAAARANGTTAKPEIIVPTEGSKK